MITEQKKEIFSVILLRTDGQHIIIENDGIEAAYSKWATYRDNWTKALHDKKPLEVIEKDFGIVTAFDPVMVYEIILRKQGLSNSNPDNPYHKEMMEKGFSNTFKSRTNGGSDLLDRGYKL